MTTRFHDTLKLLGPIADDDDAITKGWLEENFTGANGGIPEPDDDGKLYGRSRQSGDTVGDWEEIVGGVGGTADQVAMGTGNTLTVSNAVGGYTIGSVVSASDSVWDFIKKLLNPRVGAAYVQPTLSLTGTTPLGREIGENVTPTLTPAWSQNDAGAVTAYRLLRDGTSIYSGPAPIAQTDTAFQLTGSRAYRAEADYGQGPVKNDSEGDPDPAGQIPAGTATSSTITYVAQRRAFFGRLMGGTVPNTSTLIRGLESSSLNPGNNTTMSVNAEGSRGVSFAYPATLRARTSIVSSVLGNVTSGFTETTVSVEGANGYDPINYRVYSMTSVSPFTTSDTYTLTI